MGILDNALFGAPKSAGGTGDEVVTAREFDVTQYGKKMAVLIGVITPATVGALKLFHVSAVTPAMVIASLGVTAVAIFSASLVMAVDMIARAIVTGRSAPTAPPAAFSGGSTDRKDADAPDPPPEPGEEVRVKKTETRVSRG